MRFFQKLPLRYDPMMINTQLENNPQLWDANTLRKVSPGSPHSRMSDIWVRFNDLAALNAGGDFVGKQTPHIPVWYPAWYAIPALRPVVFGLMAAVQGEMIGGVLITRIPPGMGIDPHEDHGWHVDYYDKFYVHLQAPRGASFRCGDEGIEPEEGDVYRFDNRREHSVSNAGLTDRVTLIVSIRTAMFRGPLCT
jgi:hypothetical protein